MAIRYRIDPEMDVVCVIMSGVIQDTEFTNAVDATLHDPRYHAGIDSLMDFQDVERFDVSSQTIRQAVTAVSMYMNNYQHSLRVAIVSPAYLVYGISQIYQILQESPVKEIGMFQSLESAWEWLGLSKEETGS
ncbi:MAG: hypothetical protein JXA21_11375 [Anaerolineae bacterium]|nr:hypothetical protein [Anaerolineae bacterium]